MSIIDHEVEHLSKQCNSIIESSKLTTCMKTLIRVDLNQTVSRQLTICLRFPDAYPQYNVLIELKSKTLSAKLLDGLTNLCEQRAKQLLGHPQVLEVLKFLSNYLIENPLCVVYDEIAGLRKLLADGGGELKLKQRQQSALLTAKGGQYYFKIKVAVPENYPVAAVSWDNHESNLPVVLVRFLNGQAKETARQCVESPLRIKQNEQPFVPRPSLLKALGFICEATQDFYRELCPICGDRCLPANADEVVTNDTHDAYVERVFCGHIFHQGCLKNYMREPPFPLGGKLCPAQRRHPRSDVGRSKSNGSKKRQKSRSGAGMANGGDTCSIRLSHDRWGLNVKLAEARWAQQQARERELEEVKDFLQ